MDLYTGTIKNTADNKLFTYEGFVDVVGKATSTGYPVHREHSNIKRLTRQDALEDAKWLRKNLLGAS